MFKKGLLAAVSILALSACGDEDTFEADLTGAAERPNPVTTSASGSATATIDGLNITVVGTFTSLSAAATAAHIHGPADENTAAGIVCPLIVPAATTGTITGTCVFTAEQIEQLKSGKLYVNVDTATNTAGEIRGQLK